MLDWEDVTKASVWDWFGGNGNSSLGKPMTDGYCVDTGPFANLEMLYYNESRYPHCLARAFESSHIVAKLGRNLRPKAIDRLMDIPKYDAFNKALEDNMHDTLPRIVRGDWSLFTGPNGKMLCF